MNRILEEESRITKSGKNALVQMSQRNIALHPKNYQVWFEYFMGTNQALVTDMDKRLESGEPLTMQVHEYLYDKYFATEQGQEVTQRVADETQVILKSIFDRLLSANSFSTQYQDKLDQYSVQLHDATELSQVQYLIEQLIEDTQAMAENSRELQARLEDETKKAEGLRTLLEQTKREAMTDQLTGLYNRKAFTKKFDEMLEQLHAAKETFSVLMLDVDFFKKFNDVYGHSIGDAVLRIVANEIAKHVKGADFPSRYGGEEFVVLLPKTPLKGAVVVAEHIRVAVEATKLKIVKTAEMLRTITVSIGAAQIRYNDKMQDVLERADKALYLAKQSGRNNIKTETDVFNAVNSA